jgi:hypothetical protein
MKYNELLGYGYLHTPGMRRCGRPVLSLGSGMMSYQLGPSDGRAFRYPRMSSALRRAASSASWRLAPGRW